MALWNWLQIIVKKVSKMIPVICDWKPRSLQFNSFWFNLLVGHTKIHAQCCPLNLDKFLITSSQLSIRYTIVPVWCFEKERRKKFIERQCLMKGRCMVILFQYSPGPDWSSRLRWLPHPQNPKYPAPENWPVTWHSIRSFPCESEVQKLWFYLSTGSRV